nr:PadR family transcriptional regulator [Actinomycetales bacterium]
MGATQWPASWLKGVLDLALLALISRGPTYGYELSQALADSGLGEIKGGTLYPALSRLETAGLVSTEWRAGDSGPGRKYYELTTPGRAELAERSQGWGGFAGAIAGVLSGARTAPEHSESRETS